MGRKAKAFRIDPDVAELAAEWDYGDFTGNVNEAIRQYWGSKSQSTGAGKGSPLPPDKIPSKAPAVNPQEQGLEPRNQESSKPSTGILANLTKSGQTSSGQEPTGSKGLPLKLSTRLLVKAQGSRKGGS